MWHPGHCPGWVMCCREERECQACRCGCKLGVKKPADQSARTWMAGLCDERRTAVIMLEGERCAGLGRALL